MLDGADEIVFFAQTAVEFHVERADRLEEPGNWIALIELFRNAAHFGDDDRRKIDLGFFVEPGLAPVALARDRAGRSEEHTSELHSLMRISYAVFCLKKKRIINTNIEHKDYIYR